MPLHLQKEKEDRKARSLEERKDKRERRGRRRATGTEGGSKTKKGVRNEVPLAQELGAAQLVKFQLQRTGGHTSVGGARPRLS